MRLGKEAALVTVGFGLCLLIGGCMGGMDKIPLSAPLDARGVSPQPRAPSPAVPDLRIPADAVAAATEIPIVPLPLPPAPRQTTPAVPVSRPATPTGSDSGPAQPVPPMGPDAAPGIDNVRRLVKLAAARYDGMDSYIARLTRREQVRGENKPEEIIDFRFRKQPWSVYFKWVGTAGRGREVIYVKGQYENKIHTLLAAGDMPLAAPGKRMALAPDSIFVRNASRHPVTEAGLGASVERLTRVLDGMERGDPRRGTLTDLGTIARPEFVRPVAAIEHIIPPGLDPNLTRGGRCTYCFDPVSNLPVLVVMRDDRGQEVEYYFYDRVQFPVRLDDFDFNPDKLWAKPAARP